MKVSESRGELRVDIREWRDDKPTKKGTSLTLMHWKNWVNQLEFTEKALHEKKSYRNHIGGNVYCTVEETSMCVCGYKIVQETRGRGDTHQKGDLFKTIRLRSLEKTVNHDRKRFTRT